MSFGVYVHIPYCIQRCHYCDFTTFEQNSIMPPAEYLDLLLSEIDKRSFHFNKQLLTSVYFGGGTPSLLPSNYIHKILNKLDDCGLVFNDSTEVTIEINPATINPQKLTDYLNMGVNRFSLGAQSFSDSLLKICGREHNAQQTRETLDLLASNNTNFSLDILYALPTQSLPQLKLDLLTSLTYSPQHVSAYCLTVPRGHSMNENRPSDNEQMRMLDYLSSELVEKGFEHYEISNFALPNRKSKHNLLYWQDQAYWGIGLSAHSSLPYIENGLRFWNPKDFKSYISQVDNHKPQSSMPLDYLPDTQYEKLQIWEALTDYCHVSLRLNEGLSIDALRNRFGDTLVSLVSKHLETCLKKNWVSFNNNSWKLSNEGVKLSNKVFYETTFSQDDFVL